MRLLVIVVGVLLATVSANPVDLEADLEEDDVELDIEDVDADLGQMLQGLFDARDPRDVEEEETEEVVSEDDQESEEGSSPSEQAISPQEVARFNNYMDAIYRRMNAALRAKMMDPMTLNLNQKIKKDKEKKEKINHREVREAEEEEVDETVSEESESDVESVDRMGKLGKGKKALLKEKGKTAKGKGKNKKNKNKNVEKKGKKDKKKDTKKTDKKKPKLNKEERKKRREANKQKKKNKANGKGDDREKRSGKHKHGDKHNKKHSKSQKEKSKGKGKGKGKGQKHNDKKSRDGKAEGPAMGSLSGMATLRRDGDVQIKNAENHKVVKSLFSVGPLSLEVSKKYGSGKARTVRVARAKTAVMQGVMQLKVKEDGSAHILNVIFKKPEDVAVTGSISDNRKRSDNFVKNSVNKMRPLAAQKILKTARYVLKAPHSKKSE